MIFDMKFDTKFDMEFDMMRFRKEKHVKKSGRMSNFMSKSEKSLTWQKVRIFKGFETYMSLFILFSISIENKILYIIYNIKYIKRKIYKEKGQKV